MKDFEAIKALWKVQNQVPFDYNEIIKALAKRQAKHNRKLLIQTLGVTVLLVVILFIWIIKPFSTWTTHLSMLLLSASLVYFWVLQIKQFRKATRFSKHLLTPEQFISQLKKDKKKNFKLYKHNYTVFTIGIGLAFFFILFELYFILPFWLLLLFSIFAGLWFAFSYYFLLKAYLTLENQRLKDLIEELERIHEQLKNNS